MHLLRTAFCLSVIVLLLPADAKQQARLYEATSNYARQAATFCERNADTCAKGAEYWAQFRAKMEFGVRLAVDVVSEHMAGASAATPAAPPAAASPARAPARGTLTQDDLAPAWRGGPAASRT